MTIVRVNIVFLVILWSSALALEEMKRLDPAEAGFSTERLLKISSGMQKYIDDELTPGVLTAIARKGKIIHLETQGYMDVENEIPLREDTIFRIASMTKPIASIALMILWEEGHFQLNDPVSKFIPSFSRVKVSSTSDASGKTGVLEDPRRDITIKHVLTHTAGLANSYIGNRQAYRKAMYVPRPKNLSLIHISEPTRPY